MTSDEITSIAREAGFVGMDGLHKGLCRFAAIVAAAEREACAKICESVWDAWDAANEIRARGEKGQS